MSTKSRRGLFNVIDSFIIRRRNEVYLIGTLEEGELEAGWLVNVPLNKSIALTWSISQVEDVEMTNMGGVYKLLFININDPGDLEDLFALNIGSELLDITVDGQD